MSAKQGKVLAVIAAFSCITAGAFVLADAITESPGWLETVRSLGIMGTILIGIVTGLNAFVPIPPATFSPLFIESGLSPLLVIAGFVIGTTIADSLGYLLGWFGQGYAEDSYPKITAYLRDMFEKHARAVPLLAFAFFSLAPLPNEIALIPLALIGYRYEKLLAPLLLGNIIHHSIMVFGYAKIFSVIF